jgi:MFS family permease
LNSRPGRAMNGGARGDRLPVDFWLYFSGQATSALGGSFTQFALPLLIFQSTGSATSLGAGMAVTYLPYLLFGLVIGSIADRVDRKKMMIYSDVARATLVALLPLLALFGNLHVTWIYIVTFLQTTLRIFFDAGEFAGIASLVSKDQLVAANGRVQASYSAASVIGPVLAGLLVEVVPVVDVLFVDATTFLLSAVSLALIRRSFNDTLPARSTGVRTRGLRLLRSLAADIAEGLRYVWRHPVLRSISIMMALVNLFAATTDAQLVLFATRQLGATTSQIGFLYAAGGAGIVVLSLLAGPLRARFRFSRVALTALILYGAATIGLGLTSNYAVAALLWASASGLAILFNVNTLSLRQQIVPNSLLGRVTSIASVVAWSVIPFGALVGGVVITAVGSVSLTYATIGAVIVVVAIIFSWSPLGHAERYLTDCDSQSRDDHTPAV